MERDYDLAELAGAEYDFNSHAHVERDLAGIFCNSCGIDFNSHAHVERDESWIEDSKEYQIFQLTRSRGA